ncbi:MAG: hypothetical protein BAJALOKI3v1_100037 [Promethearchaeota archaeon]|nr:MAG: hypothetical protein BAJALOKI3v1_100037 [Candidatus Lokiarchaeota archaeon]
MTVICRSCGTAIDDEDEPGKYYCANCGKYTEFFKMESEKESES